MTVIMEIFENEIPIQMVDLKSQYLALKSELDSALFSCLENAQFIKGPQVGEFELQLSKYLQGASVISCANGTDALQISLMCLSLKAGDEVIVPAFSYVAAAEAVALLGLTPVMVDVNPDTFNMNPNQIEEALSTKTRAIIPVHLFGQCADMERITGIASKHQLYVIEDNAQAIGATYTTSQGRKQMAGTIGDIGTTSFFPSKNLGCYGDGGAIMTWNQELAATARIIANHGQREKYVHELVGINSRLDTIQAVILIQKLKCLNQYTEARQNAARYYDEALSSITNVKIPTRFGKSTHVFNQYTIKVPAPLRDSLKKFLDNKGIPTMIYYPIPLSKQSAYRDSGREVGDLAHTRQLCQSVLSLPMHTSLSQSQLERIVNSIASFFR